MIRFAFALFAALLVYASFFLFMADQPLLAGMTAIALVIFMVYGSHTEEQSNTQRIHHQNKLYANQAQWSGTELILRPRWFKRLLVIAINVFIFLCLLMCAISIRYVPDKNVLLYTALIGSIFLSGYATWLTLTGLVRELVAGYSLKLDSQGFTLAGYQTIPWHGVYRAGHVTSQGHNNRVRHALHLELSTDEIKRQYPNQLRAFLIGPLDLGLPRVRKLGQIRLSETFLSLPVPMIVTAFCQIGSRYAPHSVVKLVPYESLEDARQLAFLSSKLLELSKIPTFDLNKLSTPRNQMDTDTLDELNKNFKKKMESWDQQLKISDDISKEYWQLQNKLTIQSNAELSKKMKRDLKLIQWFFVGAFFIFMAYNTVRWLAS